MAIEKMKFVNISGLLTDLDRVLKEIFKNGEIHLEDAAELFSEVSGIKKFDRYNAYENLYTKINEACNIADISPVYDSEKITENEIPDGYIDGITKELRHKIENINELKNRLYEDEEISHELTYFLESEVDMYSFFHLNNIKFRFGSMPTVNYKKIEVYLGDINALLMPLKTEGESTYVMYFVSPFWKEQVDNTLRKLSFRRIRISDRIVGTPKVAKVTIEEEIEELKNEIAEAEESLKIKISELSEPLSAFYSTILYNYKIYGIRELLARGDKTFHLTGFVPADFAEILEKTLEKEKNTIILAKEPQEVGDLPPPTKLKNNPIVKPFEMMVNLFSLPSYYELDPTPFFAIAYSLLFGIMFADIGQGIVLSIGGYLFYKYKKSQLGGILAVAGICSAIFGVLFGSIFGDEHVIHALLLNPMHDSETMNETLLGAVAIGFILIICAMIFNLINAIRTKRVAQLFTSSGFAGMVFYISGGIIAVLSVIRGHYAASLIITGIFLVLPLLLIFLKEPLTNMIEKKKHKLEAGYFVESFFELFETLLSYITNTMSFIRVGAFALNHIGMMSVVYILAGSGAARIPIIVIGNIFVMGIEGLIVGIQVLRLMFYELFSKFYTGGGKDYTPFKIEE